MDFWSAVYQTNRGFNTQPYTRNERPWVEIYELEEVLPCLPNGKAPGIDGITNELLKLGAHITIDMVQTIVEKAVKRRAFSDSFKKAKTVLIPKGTPTTEATDYRPIALLNTFYKVIDLVITRNITKEIDPKLGRNQNAFRKGGSTGQHALMTQLAIEINASKGKNTYVIDLDIQKAYDSCDRNDARDNLKKNGVRDRDTSMWEMLNTNPKTDLYFNNKIIGTFE